MANCSRTVCQSLRTVFAKSSQSGDWQTLFANSLPKFANSVCQEQSVWRLANTVREQFAKVCEQWLPRAVSRRFWLTLFTNVFANIVHENVRELFGDHRTLINRYLHKCVTLNVLYGQHGHVVDDTFWLAEQVTPYCTVPYDCTVPSGTIPYRIVPHITLLLYDP